MNSKTSRRLLHIALLVIASVAGVVFFARLWPVVLLLLPFLVFYALWYFFHGAKRPAAAEPAPAPMPVKPVSEQSLLADAFGLLQRRISNQVAMQYPAARWVWDVPDAYGRFIEGRLLTILLNGAGGYKRAAVVTQNMQYLGLLYMTAPEAGAEKTEQPESAAEAEVDYGLLAFEWVNANLQRLHTLHNEAIQAGRDAFCIPAEELPHGDSWETVCRELACSGYPNARPQADGIYVTIKTEEE